MTDPTTRHAHGRRLAYLRGNRYGLALACLAMLTSILFFTGSSDAPTLEATLGGHWPASIALGIYGIGGAFVVYGLSRPNPAVEMAGLLMLAGVLAFYSFAIVFQAGAHGWQTALMDSLLVGCFLDRAFEIRSALSPRGR
jgi:hypothetical protein